MSSIIRYPYLASGFSLSAVSRPGFDLSFDGVTWPDPGDPLNVQPQSTVTGRLTYQDITDDWFALGIAAMEAEAAAQTATNTYFNVYFNAETGRVEIESDQAFWIKFRSLNVNCSDAAEGLGFEIGDNTINKTFAAAAVDGVYRLSGDRPSAYIWCPFRGLADEFDVGEGYVAAQSRAYSGRVVTETQSARFVSRRLVFEVLWREFVTNNRAASGASVSAAQGYINQSFEAFLDRNRGNTCTFYDARALFDDGPVTLGSGQTATANVLPTAPPLDSTLNRADILCVLGIGKGRRRHIASQVGVNVYPSEAWRTGSGTTGRQPATSSQVAFLFRRMRGVLDSQTFGGTVFKRIEGLREAYSGSITLHVEDWNE